MADNLPKKHAGAGLARKIGMDLALHRFNQLNRPDGMILSLDADTQIEKNYFTAIDKDLKSVQEDISGCIIRFAHTFEEGIYSDAIKSAIVSYELHL